MKSLPIDRLVRTPHFSMRGFAFYYCFILYFMKIFIAHASSYDYKNELYLLIRKSYLNNEHEIILPIENGREVITKEMIKSCDLVIAEVSYPSTGMGIELGWADIFKIPIYCIY